MDTDPTKRKHLDWVQRYNTILGDWSGSWASLPPRRFSTPKLFIGILQQATLEVRFSTPKRADFGFARLFSEVVTHVSTARINHVSTARINGTV